MSSRERVRDLYEQGRNGRQIARELGLSKATVSYHLSRLGKPVNERCSRRYDWGEIQRYYDEGNSIAKCQEKFGFSRQTWNDARKRGAVVSRPQAMPVEDLLSKKRNRNHLKIRLFRLGLKEERCEVCGIDSWLGKPLGMCLHHVNGDGHDNRLQNLQILCPNCHAQTENFSGRNKGRAKLRLVEGQSPTKPPRTLPKRLERVPPQRKPTEGALT